jgi:hypothetical protein
LPHFQLQTYSPVKYSTFVSDSLQPNASQLLKKYIDKHSSLFDTLNIFATAKQKPVDLGQPFGDYLFSKFEKPIAFPNSQCATTNDLRL